MNDRELIFNDSKGHLVVIMGHVVERLIVYRQIHRQTPESAGVLIGERRGPHLVICDLSEPGLGDIRQRYRVNRKGSHHQSKVESVFIESEGTQQYLGEWHTHPEDIPSPSSTDSNSWVNIIADEPMLMLIVGREDFWLGKKERKKINILEKVEA